MDHVSVMVFALVGVLEHSVSHGITVSSRARAARVSIG
jgi:hypothetical protein